MGKKTVWGNKFSNVFPVRVCFSVYYMMAPCGSSVTTIHHTEDSHLSLAFLHITLYCSCIKYQSGVCLQNWGVENYCCADTPAVSLPPTLALTLDAAGCPPPFEMLMDFSRCKTQNFLPSLRWFILPTFLFLLWPSVIHGSPFHKQLLTWQNNNSSNNKRPTGSG